MPGDNSNAAIKMAFISRVAQSLRMPELRMLSKAVKPASKAAGSNELSSNPLELTGGGKMALLFHTIRQDTNCECDCMPLDDYKGIAQAVKAADKACCASGSVAPQAIRPSVWPPIRITPAGGQPKDACTSCSPKAMAGVP